jgi:hypothetical protein
MTRSSLLKAKLYFLKGENEWNPWVKFFKSISRNAPAAGFVRTFARFFMTAYQILHEAGYR